MEFLAADGEVTGKYPTMSGPAAYDRLLVIRDCLDWDRCLVMDYDQLVLCDLAPLFDLELGDHLLAAHMQGPGVDMAYAMRVWLKRPLPEGWEHVAGHPYFLMPPLLNLKAMRKAGTWERFMAAHAAFGADEQLSLTAATEGRTLPLDRKWNLFPKLHIADGEVPAGVIHWSGWPKPWHKGAKVWRPDIWESEQASWEHLRMGIWGKPFSVELEPEDDRMARDLARRGWRVIVFSNRSDEVADVGVDRRLAGPVFPDLELRPACRDAFQRLLGKQQGEIDQVRLGAWEDPAKWLDGAPVAPAFLVAQGAMDAEEADRLRLPGYDAEARLMTGEWPGGGPLPRALEYQAPRRGSGVGPGEALYLRRTAAARAEAPPRVAKQPERPAPRHLERIGLCVIATANYRMYIRPLLRSVRRNFLPGYEVTVLLFTDGAIAAEEDLRVIPVEHSRWPGMAIRRYPLFREHAAVFERMDYLYYLDADMRVIDKVGPEILGDLVATVHPGFHDKPREKFTYERRQESTACIEPDDGIRYYCGAFQGGRTERYLEAVDMMAERIDKDTAKGITAVWHDESHWNRYLIEHPPTLELCPSYCWYPDGRSRDFEGKIAVVLKDAALMRA
jgi:histo-blood group ABO system transferase